MTIGKAFESQIKNNLPATEQGIRVLINPIYHSGKKINVGDIVLWAKLREEDGSNTVIILHPDDIKLYSLDRKVKKVDPELPCVILKNKK